MKTCFIETNETTRPKSEQPTLNLARIARKQKTLTWLTVPWVILALAPVPRFLFGVETIGFWIVHISCIVLCCQLARLIRKNPIVWILLAIVPIVNLFTIARLVAGAGRLLKVHGIRAGLTVV